MSPRRNRRTPGMDREIGRGAFSGPQWTEDEPGGEWIVRPVAGAEKTYRCPGCDHEIFPGVGHVVAWPVGGADERRHWHRPCWDRRRRQAG